MKSDKGFTLVEALVAMSVVMMVVITVVPLDIFIKREREILYDRRIIVAHLHDKLQHTLWNESELQSELDYINDKYVSIDYINENQLIKGCATWENAKQQAETKCLYGYR